jgi:hypothetical protein
MASLDISQEGLQSLGFVAAKQAGSQHEETAIRKIQMLRARSREIEAKLLSLQAEFFEWDRFSDNYLSTLVDLPD